MSLSFLSIQLYDIISIAASCPLFTLDCSWLETLVVNVVEIAKESNWTWFLCSLKVVLYSLRGIQDKKNPCKGKGVLHVNRVINEHFQKLLIFAVFASYIASILKQSWFDFIPPPPISTLPWKNYVYRDEHIFRISDILEETSVTINMDYFVDFWINEAEMAKSNKGL